MESLQLNQLRQNSYFATVGSENETYGFLNRGVRIEPIAWGLLQIPTPIPAGEITPMALQNVDIIDIQPFQAVFHRREDMLT